MVYRVKERNGRSLCIKLLHTVDEGVRRNFFGEIIALYALKGMYCPYLVKSGSIATMPYHICEWVDGQCIVKLLGKIIEILYSDQLGECSCAEEGW